ncbi:SsrA-binding protein [Sphingomonas kyeonggiensis]|uniref:SsrA-binding protein n=2 Tax=Sphingomonadaceae TaxID=41297 RepID=A0A7W7K0E0_9SPHN|nr:SsrA-binding protein [Sphingomonas kyeonggiensis]
MHIEKLRLQAAALQLLSFGAVLDFREGANASVYMRIRHFSRQSGSSKDFASPHLRHAVASCRTGLALRAFRAYIAPLMARPRPAQEKVKTVAENRRARFDYFIEHTYEAGIALTGTEVKSLRFGEGSIAEAYAEVTDSGVWLVNSNIPEFSHGNRFNHEPKRPRKLLLHEREINKLHGAVAREGMTLVPLSIYFNGRGRAKVELALAKGKKTHDKRESIKERDWKREQGRLLRGGRD